MTDAITEIMEHRCRPTLASSAQQATSGSNPSYCEGDTCPSPERVIELIWEPDENERKLVEKLDHKTDINCGTLQLQNMLSRRISKRISSKNCLKISGYMKRFNLYAIVWSPGFLQLFLYVLWHTTVN